MLEYETQSFFVLILTNNHAGTINQNGSVGSMSPCNLLLATH